MEFINPFATSQGGVQKTTLPKQSIAPKTNLVSDYSDEEQLVVNDIKKKGGTDQDASEIISQYRAKKIPIQSVLQSKGLVKATTPAPAPSKPIFQDTRADEGIIEQGLKAIPRGIADTAQFALGGVEQTSRGMLNLVGRPSAWAGEKFGNYLRESGVDLPKVEGLKPWEPMKENVFSNTIGAAKEAALGDKSFSEAYKEANKADVERYGNQGVGGDLLDIGTGIRKAGVSVAAPYATAAFSTAANAPGVQYAPQALNAALMAPVNYADRKLDLGMNEGTKENIAFNLGMGLTKPFAKTELGNTTGLAKYHQANDAVMSPIVKPVQQAGKVALEKGGQVVQQTKQGTKNMIDESLIGIDKSKRAAYESNPYLGGENGYVKQLTKEMQSPEGIADIKDTVTRHVGNLADEVVAKAQQARTALTEDAPIYQAIRKMPVEVESAPILSSFESAIRQKGLDIVDGNVVRPEGSAGGKITTSDVGKINQIYRDMLADSKKGYLTAEEMLQSRKNADGKVNWNEPLSTDGANMIKQMRAIIDSNAKEKIPGLKQIDKLHVDQLEKFDKATEGLIQKGGANKGEVRDNIVNILKNLNNSAKSKLNERLSEIMPELSSKIEAINMLPEIYKNLAKSEVEGGRAGNKIAGATVGGAVGTALGPVGILVGSLLGTLFGSAIGKGIANAKIKRIIQIVDSLTPERQSALKAIIEKTKQGEALTKEQVRLKEEIMSKIQEETVRGKVFPKEKNLMLPAPKEGNLSTPVNVQGKVIPNEGGKILAKPSDKEIITQSKQELKQNSNGSNIVNNSRNNNVVASERTKVIPKVSTPERKSVKQKVVPKEIKNDTNSVPMPERLIEIVKSSKNQDDMVSKLREETNNSYEFRDAIKAYEKSGGKNMTYSELFGMKKSLTKPTPESPFKNNKGFINPSAIKESLGKVIPKKNREAEDFYNGLVEAGNSPIVAQRETAKQFGTIRAMSASKAGTFGGEGAKEAPKTGWFKGADGKMKFEIDDSKANFEFPKRTSNESRIQNAKANFETAKLDDVQIKDAMEIDGFKGTPKEYRDELIKHGYEDMYNIKSGNYRLGDILQHSDLYKQYPWLENTPVSFHTEGGMRSAGEMTNGKISIALNAKDPKSVILHEIQHIIQEKEGFARGGNPESFKQGIEYYKKLADYNRDILGDIRYDKMLEKDKTSIAYKKLVKEEEEALRTYKIANEKYKELSSISPMESYNNQAGEVESRNVQTRMNMTAKERALKSVESTEDVPRNKQIVRLKNDGTSMSIDKAGTMDMSKAPDALIQEAKKYKSADEFVNSHLFHGSPNKIEGGELKYGMKKGQDSGGIFLTDSGDVANVFTFGKGTISYISPSIKNKVIDLTTPEGKNIVKSFIGKKYKTWDGDILEFSKYDFDMMFPSGKTDFASVSMFPEVISKIIKDNKKIGIAFNEYAGGKVGKTYQILEGNIPVKTESQLKQIYEQANKTKVVPKKTKVSPNK